MKKVFLLFGLFVLVLCCSVQKVEAQIEDIYYPYHNYLNYYLPDTLPDLGYNAIGSGLELNDNVRNGRLTYVSPYNFGSPARVDSCKIYGLAACISDLIYPYGNNEKSEVALYAYNEGLLNDAELEAVIFEGTEGDSILHLVKSQVFTVRHGQYPDKGLHLSDTGGVRVGVYEFYFDTPVTVKGTFFVGLRYNGVQNHSYDNIYLYDFYVYGKNMPYYSAPTYGQCTPGYNDVECKYDSLFWCWSSSCGSSWASCDNIPATIPEVEKMGLSIARIPGIFPIIKSKNNAVDKVSVEADGVEVVPNPTWGRAAVHSNRAIRSVSVCDMNGREVIRKSFLGEQYTVELPDTLPQGCYVVRVVTVQGTAVKKLVVE